jgi:hypothetical protein
LDLVLLQLLNPHKHQGHPLHFRPVRVQINSQQVLEQDKRKVPAEDLQASLRMKTKQLSPTSTSSSTFSIFFDFPNYHATLRIYYDCEFVVEEEREQRDDEGEEEGRGGEKEGDEEEDEGEEARGEEEDKIERGGEDEEEGGGEEEEEEEEEDNK